MIMKGRLMRNKVLGLLFLTLFILSVVLGCSNKHNEVNTDKLEKRTSVETSQPKEKQNISEGTLTYTNLNSKSSIDEVKSSLKTSEIRSEYADRVLEWVADYNNCMRNCDEFSLTGDFITVSAKAIDYGDYSKMSREWFRKNNRNYHDVLCRIVAFELNQDNIETKKMVKKSDFDCWDEDESWLYTDGDILFGRKPSDEDSGCVPFPLLSWSDEAIAKYFTIFNPVFVNKKCNEDEMLQAINNRWDEYGVSFNENSHSLITFWTQLEDEIAVSHAGVLAETEYGFLFFEKTNPEEPYAATKFLTIDALKNYLYEKIKLECSKDGSEVGRYIILKNDKKI